MIFKVLELGVLQVVYLQDQILKDEVRCLNVILFSITEIQCGNNWYKLLT